MEPLLVGVEEAARALGIGRTSLYEMINRQELTPIRIGRRVLVAADEIRAWVDRQRQAAREAGQP